MFTSFTLTFAGEPVHQAPTWQETAAWALSRGLATRAFGVLFVLVPGAKIEKR